MEKDGKIFKVNHSEWASPIVPVKKNDGSYRLCVDFKKTVNPNLNIDIYPLPKAEDVFATMSGGSVFVVLDLTDAYQQLIVSESSQPLLTINTHKGLYRFTRLIYGIASAPAIFQKIMDQILSGIPNTCCYIDDILIKGNNMKDCLDTVRKVLERLDKYNVKVKEGKCTWFSESVEYLGHVICKEGRKPSKSLVEAIVKCKKPENVKELRSYLGMLNFYNNYIGNLSTLTKPLRELIEKNVKWNWSDLHQQSFELSKQKLLNSDILVHYDPSLPLVLFTDASPVGLGAVLCHAIKKGNNKLMEKPIAFASCSLTKVQQNYSQLDREALGIIYAVTKFHKYLWGRQFTLITDNAPIRHIFHPSKNVPTLATHRLQHWALILSSYNYDIQHRKSDLLCHADALSRLPINKIVIDNSSHINESVLLELPMSHVDIACETAKDCVLSKVLDYVKVGWPNYMNDPAILPYFRMRFYINVVDDCLLFGSRVIVPPKCQAKVLDLLHEGHPGIVRTKLLARSSFWWPNMSTDIENKCKSCESCAAVNFKSDNTTIPCVST
ncbi:uncharacterized protein K02A2.6-like [Hyposmocoma kahamanoa]|nr:uncharacterized protein K02A2.6-like [Hyposmocoma kahamanoa]